MEAPKLIMLMFFSLLVDGTRLECQEIRKAKQNQKYNFVIKQR